LFFNELDLVPEEELRKCGRIKTVALTTTMLAQTLAPRCVRLLLSCVVASSLLFALHCYVSKANICDKNYAEAYRGSEDDLPPLEQCVKPKEKQE